MATTTTGNGNEQKQASLPDPQQAYDHLFNNVHANVFFQKLASRGYQPQNEKEAADLLALAGKLRVAAQTPQIEQATAGRSKFAQASGDLDRLLNRMGVDAGHQQAAQEQNAAIKSAADQLMNDPAIYNSVLSLKAAEAEHLKGMFATPRA